jgi:hypothetical protein
MFFKLLHRYSVLIEGENVLMDLQGVQRFGFFTTRYVKAADVESASQRAVDLAREELLSAGLLLNERGDNPLITVSEIRQIKTFNGASVPGKGFTFYPMRS